jgi:hypothetical protein
LQRQNRDLLELIHTNSCLIPILVEQFKAVVAGLVPAIHVLFVPPQDVDIRDKPGHDERPDGSEAQGLRTARGTG